VATLNVIRRWALRDQMSIREISRRTGLARNTVKKHLRSEESELSYQRRATPSKLDPYAEKLATWLVIEATKSRKQRRTLRQIHTLSPKRRKPRTYPHREHLQLTKSEGQYSMENSGQTSAQFNNFLSFSISTLSGVY
jgi:transposase